MNLTQRIRDTLRIKYVYLHPKIYLANDATILFNSPLPVQAETVSTLQHKPATFLKSRAYTWGIGRFNHVVKWGKTDYFITEAFEGNISIWAVTTPCIVIAAYSVDREGNITSSGAYHAESLPPSRTFRDRVNLLIDSLDHQVDREIVVKGIGYNEYKSSQNSIKIREEIQRLFENRQIEFNPDYLVIGEGSYRATLFNPRNGALSAPGEVSI